MFEEENNTQSGYGSANENTSNQETQNMSSEYRYRRDDIPYNTQDYRNTTSQEATQNQEQTGNSYQSSYGQNSYQDHTFHQNYYSAGSTSNQTTFTQEPDSNQKKHKRKSGNGGIKTFFQKKMVKRVAASLLCGVIAGGAMLGTFYAGIHILPGTTNNKSNYEIATVTSNVTPTASVVAEGAADVVSSDMDVSSVAKAALPAMVALKGTTTVSGGNSLYGLFGGAQSYEASTSGTGIIVGKNDTELLILTNNHVIEDVNDLQCVFVDDSTVSATVKGAKSDKDIAVVAVNLSDISADTLSKIAIAELGDSEDVVVGQQVVAIGNALGEGQSVTTGIISALNRSITVDNVTFTGLFLTNAAINSGNSGGAMLDASGKVIGINFAKTSETGVEGMAYSIPVSTVRDLIDSLMNRQTRTKVSASEASYLGISAMDITSAMATQYGYPQGILIRQVASGSAAEKAGLGAYDIIVSFDDQTISSFASLQSTMQYYAAGETVQIEYYHLEGNQYVLKTATVKLDKKS